MTDLCGYREIREKDLPFVRDTWIKSYAQRITVEDKAAWPLGIDRQTYTAEHYTLVRKILERSRTIIAYVPDDDDHLVGYVCYEIQPDAVVLHYLYVKEGFRRLGIGSKLYAVPVEFANGEEMYASHWCWRFAESVKKDTIVTYNPYRGFGYGQAEP